MCVWGGGGGGGQGVHLDVRRGQGVHLDVRGAGGTSGCEGGRGYAYNRYTY